MVAFLLSGGAVGLRIGMQKERMGELKLGPRRGRAICDVLLREPREAGSPGAAKEKDVPWSRLTGPVR